MKQKNIHELLNCPTPRGAIFGGGWDTISAAYGCCVPKPGGVPPVPPLDRLSRVRAGTHVRAPERIGSRGGTGGTKFWPLGSRPVSHEIATVPVPPHEREFRPGVGQI